MVIANPVPESRLKSLKREARRLKKELGIQHAKALDQVAQIQGYVHWHDLLKKNGLIGINR